MVNACKWLILHIYCIPILHISYIYTHYLYQVYFCCCAVCVIRWSQILGSRVMVSTIFSATTFQHMRGTLGPGRFLFLHPWSPDSIVKCGWFFFTFMASRLKIVQWCLASGESKAGQDLQVPIRTLFRTLQTKATLFGLAMMQSSAMQLCHLCQVVPPVVNYRTHLGASPVQITTPRSSIFRNAGHPSKHANGIKSFFG